MRDKLNKKAQITIFIIIGIAFLAAVGLTIYVVSTTSSQRSQATLREQQLSAELIAPVDEFVTRCLKLTAEQGLEKIGKQGGLLNSSSADSVAFNDVNVAYGIIPPTRNIPPIFYRFPPEYPWPNFPAPVIQGQSIGYFGVPTIPNLESITSELETFISQKITECTESWQTFSQQGLSITSGTPKAIVNFAQEDTSISLKWTIQIESGQRKATIENFAATIPVKFKSIHSTATEIAKEESTNINFKPADLGATVNKKVDGFNDIITIKDTSSKINNVPYEFSFGRKNRVPALNKISGITSACAGATIVLNNELKQLSIPNNPTIQLAATDPDEDDIVFSLDGTSNNQIALQSASYTRSIIVVASDGELRDWQEIKLQVSKC